MPRKTTTNLYQPPTPGYYVYASKTRFNKFNAQRKFPSGFVKTWTFYSKEEAIDCLNNCPPEDECRKAIHTWADMGYSPTIAGTSS